MYSYNIVAYHLRCTSQAPYMYDINFTSLLLNITNIMKS